MVNESLAGLRPALNCVHDYALSGYVRPMKLKLFSKFSLREHLDATASWAV